MLPQPGRQPVSPFLKRESSRESLVRRLDRSGPTTWKSREFYPEIQLAASLSSRAPNPGPGGRQRFGLSPGIPIMAPALWLSPTPLRPFQSVVNVKTRTPDMGFVVVCERVQLSASFCLFSITRQSSDKLRLVKESGARLSDGLVSKSAIGERYRRLRCSIGTLLRNKMSNLEWSQCDARRIQDLPDWRQALPLRGKTK